ncbi:MAG: response regulator, partial [Gammaproteobacteria bacterium]|nr:response regulator [Gammaproteobacteria bacterium]
TQEQAEELRTSGEKLQDREKELTSTNRELQAQQESLRALNEELEEQTNLLKVSEQKLKLQQEELQVSNEELAEKNTALATQKNDIEEANQGLERTKDELEQQADELAIATRTKSEFLASMSHELRTPLNSLLLLSGMFVDNTEGNLTEDQLASAKIVHNSGNDLLSLINEILDLSKIEAGQMDVVNEEIPVDDLIMVIESTFRHMVEEKGLSLDVSVSAKAPDPLFQDRRKLEQILKNLMSNAIKFTSSGGVTVEIGPPSADAVFSMSGLKPDHAVAISVTDTGIGISADEHKTIFEAFRQAEGGTAKKYGGTGLGLDISRKLAQLLGGEIQLRSEAGSGSTFVLYLPFSAIERNQLPADALDGAESQTMAEQQIPKPPMVDSIADDRESLDEDDDVILLIEDDAIFAQLLMNECHRKGFKCLASATGEIGLELVQDYLPTAIILDIHLPGMDGWSVLKELKENSKTRHIPVHIMSAEDPTNAALQMGATGYLTKPVTKQDLDEAFSNLENVFKKEVKDLLVVEDADDLRYSIIKLIGNGDVQAEEAASGEQAIQALSAKRFDCMILDLGLPDMSGFELLRKLKGKNVIVPPVIIYTGKELTRSEEAELRAYSETIIIKGVRSEERLFDEVSLFLHREVNKLPKVMQKVITNLHDTDALLRDKLVLLVDDDMRNVFALSKILEGKGIQVIKAENGQKALDILNEEPGIDLVLMDIMMP